MTPSSGRRLRSAPLLTWLFCFVILLLPAEAKRKKSSDPLPDLSPKPVPEAPAKEEPAPAKPAPETPAQPKAEPAPAKPAPPAPPAPPAAKPTPGSPAVPGGGLAAHERAGGHLLSRHAGKTEAELIARLRGELGIASSSSFTSRQLAEDAVAFTVNARARQIAAWMKKPREERLVLDIRLNQPIGISVSRRTWKAESVKGLRLVLVKDADFHPEGWRILTGYPQP